MLWGHTLIKFALEEAGGSNYNVMGQLEKRVKTSCWRELYVCMAPITMILCLSLFSASGHWCLETATAMGALKMVDLKMGSQTMWTQADGLQRGNDGGHSDWGLTMGPEAGQ